MVRTAEAVAREQKIAGLKRLLTTNKYDSLEKLEDAVDAYLWEDDGPRQLDDWSAAVPQPLQVLWPQKHPIQASQQ